MEIIIALIIAIPIVLLIGGAFHHDWKQRSNETQYTGSLP